MKTKKPISDLKKLMNKVRKTDHYLRWKFLLIKRDFPGSQAFPKGIQVHHSVHNFSWYFEKYNITTLEEALACKELWRAPGVCLTRGEHFLLSRLSFYKYPTKGFVQLLAESLERLQLAQYHQRPTKGNKNA